MILLNKGLTVSGAGIVEISEHIPGFFNWILIVSAASQSYQHAGKETVVSSRIRFTTI
jgi:hypothetical protein